jgi:hypothetical protein
MLTELFRGTRHHSGLTLRQLSPGKEGLRVADFWVAVTFPSLLLEFYPVSFYTHRIKKTTTGARYMIILMPDRFLKLGLADYWNFVSRQVKRWLRTTWEHPLRSVSPRFGRHCGFSALHPGVPGGNACSKLNAERGGLSTKARGHLGCELEQWRDSLLWVMTENAINQYCSHSQCRSGLDFDDNILREVVLSPDL